MAENQRENGQRSLASRRVARLSRQEKEKGEYEGFVASKNKRRFQNKRHFLQQTYKQFQKANVQVDRKILAQLAEHQPNIFSKIVASVK